MGSDAFWSITLGGVIMQMATGCLVAIWAHAMVNYRVEVRIGVVRVCAVH